VTWYVYRFEVQGRHGFPLRMLTIDHCWPETLGDNDVAFRAIPHSMEDRVTRSVRMRAYSPSRNWGPDLERWQAAGWPVVEGSCRGEAT